MFKINAFKTTQQPPSPENPKRKNDQPAATSRANNINQNLD